MGLIKYLLFIFNFIFALCGLAILVVGVLIHVESNSYEAALPEGISFPAITLIVVGSIIFVIAFFGCCGAIRESHCMTITFAAFLLTLLIVQIAIGIYVFVVYKESNIDVKTVYSKIFKDYWASDAQRDTVDIVQKNLKCCGIDSYNDFSFNNPNMNGTIPSTCCDHPSKNGMCSERDAYPHGCANAIKDLLIKAGKIIGGVALGIASVEFIGIIFSLCLANSIKEMERRHYRV